MQTPNTYDTDKRKLLSTGSHASIFISALVVSIGIPIAILALSNDPVVKDNAREAINFHINVMIYGAILGVLGFLTFGLAPWLLGPLWFLYHWGLALWAVVHCLGKPDQPFRYPFIFRPV
ncbi:MAG TPA: DUF4870 domain-containing protein [Leptolyngbyaceae cyanobacterium M33_DOE_097]|uniref:DUF4870 domain-containing protein n=1 Tax=Oscillatoriales cyanobacterium SpSt-418 TaxID=2282169 RepID=A0A7C3KEU8_9CYAN|nr:DUF4870 domain-containing protein [Leptolyngbyaceae cyanobacterium M33_DOE_097]